MAAGAWRAGNATCPQGQSLSQFKTCRVAVGKQVAFGQPLDLRPSTAGGKPSVVCGYGLGAGGKVLFAQAYDNLCIPNAFAFSGVNAWLAAGAARELWFTVARKSCPAVCTAAGLAPVVSATGFAACMAGADVGAGVGNQPPNSTLCLFPKPPPFNAPPGNATFSPSSTARFLCACVPRTPTGMTWATAGANCTAGFAPSPFSTCRVTFGNESYIGLSQRYAFTGSTDTVQTQQEACTFVRGASVRPGDAAQFATTFSRLCINRAFSYMQYN